MAVYIWNDLKIYIKRKKVNKELQQNLDSRYEIGLTLAHFLAYILDPRYNRSIVICNFAKQKSM